MTSRRPSQHQSSQMNHSDELGWLIEQEILFVPSVSSRWPDLTRFAKSSRYCSW